MTIIGHASVKMTLDTYSHVLPGMQESASNKLEAMLYRKSGTPRKI
jgi:integrase